MSQSNNMSRPTQLADKDVALTDYFDVLLHDATITDAPAPVSESVTPVAGSAPVVLKSKEPVFIIENEIESSQEATTLKDKSSKVRATVASEEQALIVQAPVLEAEPGDESIPEPVPDSSSYGEESQNPERVKAVETVSSEQAVDNETQAELNFSSNRYVEPESDGDEALLDDGNSSEFTEENYYVEGAPEWAHAPFQALEFTIAKLKLVIPLVHLCGILNWEHADLTPMPGHSRRFIGVWPNHGTNTKIVDVAEMLVPQRYHHKIETWKGRTTKVVLIDDSAWGLACDDVLGVVTLDPREVRWRSDRTQRAWLAGTLIEHMSALIDGDQFSATLLQGVENEMPTASCA